MAIVSLTDYEQIEGLSLAILECVEHTMMQLQGKMDLTIYSGLILIQ
jgi:hypothetical protein